MCIFSNNDTLMEVLSGELKREKSQQNRQFIDKLFLKLIKNTFFVCSKVIIINFVHVGY